MALISGKIQRRKGFGGYLKKIRSSICSRSNMEKDGILYRTISGIEDGSANYTIDSLLKYLNYLGLSLHSPFSSWTTKPTSKKELAEYLVAMREKKGFKRYHLTQLGLSYNLINAIEKGTTEYTIDSLLMYCKGIGVELKVI